MMKQFRVGLLCIGLILLLFIGISFLSKSRAVPEIGTIVTDYALATPEGKDVKLSDFSGNILVLELGSCATWGEDKKHIAEMDKVANDLKDKGVVMYHLYTSRSSSLPNFSIYKRSVLVDRNGSEGILLALCGGDSKSLVVIDKEGKLALFQRSPNPEKLRKKLEEMTSLEQEY